MDLKKSKEGHVRAWKEDREMGNDTIMLSSQKIMSSQKIKENEVLMCVTTWIIPGVIINKMAQIQRIYIRLSTWGIKNSQTWWQTAKRTRVTVTV